MASMQGPMLTWPKTSGPQKWSAGRVHNRTILGVASTVSESLPVPEKIPDLKIIEVIIV